LIPQLFGSVMICAQGIWLSLSYFFVCTCLKMSDK
jgi:hypothetical protein